MRALESFLVITFHYFKLENINKMFNHHVSSFT